MALVRTFLDTFHEIIHIEKFSASDGLLQRIDPRAKLLSAVAFVVAAMSARTVVPLIILFASLVILSILSRVPLRFFLRRSLLIPVFAGIVALPLPFITPGATIAQVGYDGILLTVTSEGVQKAAQFTARVLVCVSSLVVLVLTTRFSRLLHAMENLKLPTIFVSMTAVTYRFIFLFIDEAYRMALAKESRTVVKERWRQALGSLSHMVSTLFIRAHERGERVYLAMLARGYAGTVKSLGAMDIGPTDWLFAVISIAVCLIALSIEHLLLVA